MYSGQQKRKPLFSIAVVLVFDSARATLIAVGLALFLGLPVPPKTPSHKWAMSSLSPRAALISAAKRRK